MKTHRIPGFDLARAYAIFGMFVVNFNTVFGSVTSTEGWFGVLNLFNGNSSSLFVILAGMGVSLMSRSASQNPLQQKQLKATVLKRSWFLFIFGLLFFLWWPADILHFYGGYMHIAAFLLFVPRALLLLSAIIAVIVFHILLIMIPYQNGWDFQSMLYTDFWTIQGFLRNTIYNGWNPIFPWIAFFFLGMYLGRINWQSPKTSRLVLAIGSSVYVLNLLAQTIVKEYTNDADLIFYFSADYLPPFLPFMLGTASFAMILIGICVIIGEKMQSKLWLQILTNTGQLTLTHYVSHLTIGLLILSWITGKTLSLDLIHQAPSNPLLILGFSAFFFLITCFFSYWWKRKFKQGPIEQCMRWFSK